MIKIIWMLFLLLTIYASQAQHNNASSTADFSTLDLLQKHIELSDKQVDTIKKVIIKAYKQIAELKSQSKGDDVSEEIKKSISKINSWSESAIINMLSNEQINRFQQKGKSAAMKAKFLKMRKELDYFISNNHKSKIQYLRSVFENANKQMKTYLQKNEPNKDAYKEKNQLQKIKNHYKKEWRELNRLVRKYNTNIQKIFKENKMTSLPKRALIKRVNDQACIGRMSGDLCCRGFELQSFFEDIPNKNCLFYPACIYKSKLHFLLLDTNKVD